MIKRLLKCHLMKIITYIMRSNVQYRYLKNWIPVTMRGRYNVIPMAIKARVERFCMYICYARCNAAKKEHWTSEFPRRLYTCPRWMAVFLFQTRHDKLNTFFFSPGTVRCRYSQCFYSHLTIISKSIASLSLLETLFEICDFTENYTYEVF